MKYSYSKTHLQQIPRDVMFQFDISIIRTCTMCTTNFNLNEFIERLRTASVFRDIKHLVRFKRIKDDFITSNVLAVNFL